MLIITHSDEVPATSIILQTRIGTDIPNSQVREISEFERNYLPELRRKYQIACRFRTDLTPIYNCHGMTFSSRRTGIYEIDFIWKIIEDDNYTPIDVRAALPGDIALYLTADGDIEHSGVVVSEGSEPLFVPHICSKWGKGPEVIHPANLCPYNPSNIRYYRIRQ